MFVGWLITQVSAKFLIRAQQENVLMDDMHAFQGDFSRLQIVFSPAVL